MKHFMHTGNMLIIYIRIYLCKRKSIEIIKIRERETNLEKDRFLFGSSKP